MITSLALLGGCIFKPLEISGNVFITTKGGENLKLGLVPILLFNEEQVQETLKKAKDILLPELQELNTKLSQVQIEQKEKKHLLQQYMEAYEQKREALSELERRRPSNPRYYATPNTDVFTTHDKISEPFTINPQTQKPSKYLVEEQQEKQKQEVYNIMAQKWRQEYDMVKDQVSDAKKQAEQIEKEHQIVLEKYEKILERLQRWDEISQEEIFKLLPEPIISTKTDADGEFKLKNIPKGRHAIAATSTRTVLTKTEKYYWFIYLPPKPSDDDKVGLNNDNLLVANNTNSVIHIPITPNPQQNP